MRQVREQSRSLSLSCSHTHITRLQKVEFLKDYKASVERHFQTTVTDHFSQDVWKQLDAPDMIDAPDLDAFVFFKCLVDITMNDQQLAAGTCLIARYNRVRDFFQQGKVELM